ncbi:MAG: 3-methyl-2-oxobutanoate dehydrogenase subunit VorB [Clostridia bacterium]|nr:3-methyl-2-oxobutanoate dehydrogenase subunit VorB [Clostridia bacterium]
MAKVLMKGCEAVAEAAVRAGCRFFAGYPITPQNEIPEYMSSRMPEVGGVFVQGESEVASVSMVYGAAAAGVRSMTSSSGPGISLKSEGISYLSSTKLPALIVNVSRGGPGLGSIQPAQCDYYQMTKALGHGGFRLMCFAPATLQEAVDLTYRSFDYAERDRNPVLLLMDGCLGAIMEMVELPEMVEPDRKKTKAWNMSRFPDEKRAGKGLSPVYPEFVLEKENTARGQLLKSWEENDVQVEELFLDDAEFVIVAYGISARVAKEAMLKLREEGFKVGMIRPITLLPFPKKSLRNLDYNRVKGIIDVELAIPAQMHDDIALEVMERAPIYDYGRSGGMLFNDEEAYEAIKNIITGGAQ